VAHFHRIKRERCRRACGVMPEDAGACYRGPWSAPESGTFKGFPHLFPPYRSFFAPFTSTRGSWSSRSGAPFSFQPPLEESVYVCELTRRRYRGKRPREIRGPAAVRVLVVRPLRKENRHQFLLP